MQLQPCAPQYSPTQRPRHDYQEQAGTARWSPAQWQPHAAAAQYANVQCANGTVACKLLHSSTYLPAELMPSLAACIHRDIIVFTRDAATHIVQPRPVVYFCEARMNRRNRPTVTHIPGTWADLTARFVQPVPLGASTSATQAAPAPRVLVFDTFIAPAGSSNPTGIQIGHYTTLLPFALPPPAVTSPNTNSCSHTPANNATSPPLTTPRRTRDPG